MTCKKKNFPFLGIKANGEALADTVRDEKGIK